MRPKKKNTEGTTSFAFSSLFPSQNIEDVTDYIFRLMYCVRHYYKYLIFLTNEKWIEEIGIPLYMTRVYFATTPKLFFIHTYLYRVNKKIHKYVYVQVDAEVRHTPTHTALHEYVESINC